MQRAHKVPSPCGLSALGDDPFMGKHSGSEKKDGKGFGLLRRHPGRHADEPIFEPDPIPDLSPVPPDVYRTPETRPLVRSRARPRSGRSAVLGSVALAAAVVLILLITYVALSTDSATYPSTRPPVGADPVPTDELSGMPTDAPEPSMEPPVAMAGSTETTTVISTPQRAQSHDRPDVITVTASPSGESPMDSGSPAGSPAPTVTATQTVTPMNDRPRPTVTQTVTGHHTSDDPWSRVPITIRLPLPLIGP